MAEIIWTEPALADLDAIADYIALDKPQAARDFVQRVFNHVDQLAAHPVSGSKLPEFRGWRYRQIVEPPCRVIYRHEKRLVHIVHVVRGERLLDKRLLGTRGRAPIEK
ncbi:MAG: type II toxin-antitoxin system RelE/ParE family toxin [Proteobacteria bacterium]|nr:type II toxin-antitoxin system RelE/ParE family toxin [Pseudomonadota bacterium]